MTGEKISHATVSLQIVFIFDAILFKHRDSKVHLGSCVQLYSLAEILQLPPLPPHLGSYTRVLLVSQDWRHLFVTPALFFFRCCWLAQSPWVLEQLGVSSTPTTCPYRSHNSSSSSNHSSCNSSSNNTASSVFRRNSCLLRSRFLRINYECASFWSACRYKFYEERSSFAW